MDNDKLLDLLEETRERLLVALELLTDEQLLAPGAVGDWSVADCLVHLTVWESELVTALMRLKSGQKPTRMLEAIADVDAFNARVYAENKGRDLDRIFSDLQGVRVQLERWLENFSDKELDDPKRFRWLDGRSLRAIIEANSYGHELEHLPALEAYASRVAHESSCE
jgi:hypothetical protein